MAQSILIAGTGQLAAAIERKLRESGASPRRLMLGADGSEDLDAEDIAGYTVLILAADDDAGNVDLALRAQRLQPSLRLVVRLFDQSLAAYLGETVKDVTALSMSALAAPVFAEAARKALAALPPAPSVQAHMRTRPRRGFRADPFLLRALLALFLLVFPSALVFSHVLEIRYMDALYFVWTTVMTVGYGDIALKGASDAVKLFGMALMLAGAAFIAVLFALLSDWVLTRRLDALRGRRQVRGGGHVLIAGAGNVGYRTALLLEACGRHLVIIDRDADNRNAEKLVAAGHHVIVADAASDEMLELAGIGTAALVIAVTDSDATNLRIALHARQCGVPAIMRMLSPELSAHVSERGDGVAFSPVATAADAFARAALAPGGTA